jgi:toxin YoeB
MYDIVFTNQAEEDIDLHKKAGSKVILRKIKTLLSELMLHPYTGTGKPELLKHELAGFWSRKIDKKHRLVYKVLSDYVEIHSALGHYQ